jgi:hypothetical protein
VRGYGNSFHNRDIPIYHLKFFENLIFTYNDHDETALVF